MKEEREIEEGERGKDYARRKEGQWKGKVRRVEEGEKRKKEGRRGRRGERGRDGGRGNGEGVEKRKGKRERI